MDANKYDPDTPIQNAIGMLYSIIIRYPDFDDMLRPIVEELRKTEEKRIVQ